MVHLGFFKIGAAALLLGAGSLLPVQAGEGLRAPVDTSAGTTETAGAGLAGWSARWYSPAISLSVAGPEPTSIASSWRILGDYHFARTPGMRATGGVFGSGRSVGVGLSTNLMRSSGLYDESNQLPYLGLGYSARWPQAGLQGLGWSVSADVGLLALSPRSAIRLDRVVGGQRSLDGAVRDLRLAPLMQLGVSYGF
ncbi:MAG: hypothetical protein AB3X44_19415 [Leptothrix sp. (in: b-proteobacteria)]